MPTLPRPALFIGLVASGLVLGLVAFSAGGALVFVLLSAASTRVSQAQAVSDYDRRMTEFAVSQVRELCLVTMPAALAQQVSQQASGTELAAIYTVYGHDIWQQTGRRLLVEALPKAERAWPTFVDEHPEVVTAVRNNDQTALARYETVFARDLLERCVPNPSDVIAKLKNERDTIPVPRVP